MLDNDNMLQVIQRQLRRSLHMKKIITDALLCVLVCKATAYQQQHLATSSYI